MQSETAEVPLLREEASPPEGNMKHTLLLLLKSEVYATIAQVILCFHCASSDTCVESSLYLHQYTV